MDIKMIDTFPAFLEYWQSAEAESIEAQTNRWEAEYMAPHPELCDKQLQDYADQQVDWRDIAREKIFPFINARLETMRRAHDNILSEFSLTLNQAHEKLGFDEDVCCVVYVGIGCGAGWATRYEDKPAVLFGLENIAECGWDNANAIRGLTAHELGHLIHAVWRKSAGKTNGDGAWWQLYEEGFAQRCEHLILGVETWHESGGVNDDWSAWCKDNIAYLASEFLSYVSEDKDIRPFFGSWYSIQGHSQCGYFLGHEVIKRMELAGMNIRDIGTLENYEGSFREILETLSKEGSESK